MLKNLNAAIKPGGVSVTNRYGQLVCFVTIDKVFVAHAATPDVAQKAGEEAEKAIEQAARNAGCSSVVTVLSPAHPHYPEERWVRILERPVLFDS
jgi:hypothetical protein